MKRVRINSDNTERTSFDYLDKGRGANRDISQLILSYIPPSECLKNFSKLGPQEGNNSLKEWIPAFSFLGEKDVLKEQIILSTQKYGRLDLTTLQQIMDHFKYSVNSNESRGKFYNYGDRRLGGILSAVRNLDLSGSSINDIELRTLLSHCPKLESLALSRCHGITNLSPLAKLTKLQSLSLEGCINLMNFSPLASLVDLRSLNLNWCLRLTDFSFLGSFRNLQSFSIEKCDSLMDLSSLAHLTKLQSLNLVKCTNLTDLTLLSNFIQLEQLNLARCDNLADISPLANLTHLQHLNLEGCSSLRDVSSLFNLIHLQWLNLKECYNLEALPAPSHLNTILANSQP